MAQNRRSYTDQEKADAVAIALAAGVPEASQKTGIPAGSIKRWVAQAKGWSNGDDTGAKLLKGMTKEIRARAVEGATEYVTQRLKQMADKLYRVAEKSIEKVDVAISDANELPKGKKGEKHDRDGAAWVHSLVGVMKQSIEKAQLLAGKPTGRQEEVQRSVEERHLVYELAADPTILRAIQAAASGREGPGGAGGPAGLLAGADDRRAAVVEAARDHAGGGDEPAGGGGELQLGWEDMAGGEDRRLVAEDL